MGLLSNEPSDDPKWSFFIAVTSVELTDTVLNQLEEQIGVDSGILKSQVQIFVCFAIYVCLRMKLGERAYKLVYEYLNELADTVQEMANQFSWLTKRDVKSEMLYTFKQYNELFNQEDDSYTAIEKAFARNVVRKGHVNTTDIFKRLVLSFTKLEI